MKSKNMCGKLLLLCILGILCFSGVSNADTLDTSGVGTITTQPAMSFSYNGSVTNTFTGDYGAVLKQKPYVYDIGDTVYISLSAPIYMFCHNQAKSTATIAELVKIENAGGGNTRIDWKIESQVGAAVTFSGTVASIDLSKPYYIPKVTMIYKGILYRHWGGPSAGVSPYYLMDAYGNKRYYDTYAWGDIWSIIGFAMKTVVTADRAIPMYLFPPTVDYNGYKAGDWTNQIVTIFLNSKGTISAYQYSHDGTNWENMSNPWAISTEGNRNFYYRAKDSAGQVSGATANYPIRIDKTLPTTPTITTNNNWTNEISVPATISAGTDASSGVKKTEYSLSGATTLAWTTYTAAPSIRNEGQTTISVRTVDNAGNISATATAIIQIDRTSPTTPTITTNTNWTNALIVPVTITAGSDASSGVKKTEYSLSGATTLAWTTYTAALSITNEGQTTISVRTVDNAGNISATATAIIQIDRTSPTTPTITTNTNWTNALIVPVTITAGSDASSGVKKTEYSLSGATTLAWTNYTAGFNISSPGQTMISVRTMDNAGNISTTTNAVKIDRQKPKSGGVQVTQYTPMYSGTIRVNDYNVIDESTLVNGASGVKEVQWRSARSSDQGSTWEAWINHGVGGFDGTNAWFDIPLRGEGMYNVQRTIYDKAGNIAEPLDATTGKGETFIITMTKVKRVDVPNAGVYQAGKNIDFLVVFTKAVNVTGTPKLDISIDKATKSAQYVSGTGTDSLLFRYTIESGLYDADGIVLPTAITLNNGTIKDTVNIDANLTLNNVGNTSLVYIISKIKQDVQ